MPVVRVSLRSLPKTGVGTVVADGKELREFDGETYVMEHALVPDVVLWSKLGVPTNQAICNSV